MDGHVYCVAGAHRLQVHVGHLCGAVRAWSKAYVLIWLCPGVHTVGGLCRLTEMELDPIAAMPMSNEEPSVLKKAVSKKQPQVNRLVIGMTMCVVCGRRQAHDADAGIQLLEARVQPGAARGQALSPGGQLLPPLIARNAPCVH